MDEYRQGIIDAIRGAIYHYEHGDKLGYLDFGKVADLAADKIQSFTIEYITKLRRNLYWSRMELDGVDVPWCGEFILDHRNGQADFVRENGEGDVVEDMNEGGRDGQVL